MPAVYNRFMTLNANSEIITDAGLSSASTRSLHPGVFYTLVFLVFTADQISKAWIQRTLYWEQSRPIFGEVFNLTLTRNTGGAWGLLPHGNTLFISFAVIAVIALIVAYHRLPNIELHVGTAFALAMGGALGNLADRIRHGFVVDFFYLKVIHFPIFNIADSCITIGICLLMYHFLISPKNKQLEHSANPTANTQEPPIS